MKVLAALPALFWLLAVCPASAGQSNQPPPPECAPAALDANLAFSNDRPGENTVAVNHLNISESACVLHGGIGAMFGNWHAGHNIWAKECRNCEVPGLPQPSSTTLVLKPGQSGYFLLRWKNVSDGTQPCIDADGFNTTSDIVIAPSILAHVCSVVDEQSFLPGTYPTREPDTGGKPDPAGVTYSVELTAPSATLYARDRFPFHALVIDPGGHLALDDRSCPILFIRTRHSDGSTMFYQATTFLKCEPGKALNSGRSIDVEMIAPGLGVLNEPGQTSVRFYLLVSPAQASDVSFVSSNALEVNIVDPATLPPAWGPQVGGLAASLVLDKEKYFAGEEIPLRINLENFKATEDIGSGELPCFAGLTVEVRDAAGSVVPRPNAGWMCSGHGWQTKYPVDKQVYVQGLTLSNARQLLDRPGDYTLTLIWSASSFTGPPSAIGYRPLQPYAVVRSLPVRFSIIAPGQ